MTYLPYGAIEAFDCERVAIVLPSSAYKEGQYPESIVVHHSAGLNATPVKFGIEYVPKEVREKLAAEKAKLRELVFDMLVDEERGHNDDGTFYDHVERANELGVRFDG